MDSDMKEDNRLQLLAAVLQAMSLGVDRLLDEQSELQQLMRENPEKAAKLFTIPPEFHYLYEQSFTDLTKDLVRLFGSDNPTALGQDIGFMPHDQESGDRMYEEMDKRFQGDSDNPSAENLYLIFSLISSYNAIDKYCFTMQELVCLAEDGDDAAMFMAINIDSNVRNLPFIAEKIRIAEHSGNDKFLSKLNSAVRKISPVARDPKYRTLRLMLVTLIELKLFEQLTHSDKAILFIDMLKVYPNDGDDPEGSLKLYINEFKRIRRKVKT